jgi:hypothetical protein
MQNRALVAALAISMAGASTIVRAQRVDPPEILGTLAGEGAPQQPRGVHLYGTDLGWTFSHRDDLYILFGDSWSDETFVCSVLSDGLPTNDDSQGTLPRTYRSGVPHVSFETERGSLDYSPIRVSRNGAQLPMGANRTPLTGFSDGERPIGVFESATWVPCGAADGGAPTCASPFVCNTQLGQCQPRPFGIPQICDVERQVGCLGEQTCEPSGPGYCVDPSSSQPDAINQVALELEFGVPAKGGPTHWDSRLTVPTNKFLNVASRTIRNLDPHGSRSDYAPGHGTLLMWGRPGFYSGPGFSTGLYLLAHDLPFQEDEVGKLAFSPRYFAGLDRRGRPRWSSSEVDAVPLALDGTPAGDATEQFPAVNQMTISWLDTPIRKWVMFYGGGPLRTEAGNAPGLVAMRFADHPWGPWSAPQVLLSEGAPDRPNTPLGPGGVLFHPSCVDQGDLKCARTDPVRPLHILNPECAPPEVETDAGYFYAANIIEEYTQRSGRDALDVYWNLSAWNPYRVWFLHTRFHAR